MEFEYQALAFTPRRGHDALFMIAAPASDIVQWADAPHKQVGVRAGYQRELDERRTTNIKEFIEIADQNILPSAALIAMRDDSMEFRTDSNGQSTFVVTTNERPLAERRADLIGEFKDRLSEVEIASVASVEDVEDVEAASLEDPIPADDDDLSDVVPPESYLAGLYAELVDYDSATEDRKLELDELVETFTLPGLIIDGQHRIFGAKEANEAEVRIPAVLLPRLDLAEQVFHFYVLNNKAKPLDKRQLRSIVSTSLTKKEIDDLYARFRKSGLRADEAQWTYRIGSDGGSPFKNLVSLRLRGDAAPIDDNVMDQVVSRFIKMPRQYNSLKRGVKWDSDDSDYSHRLQLFYTVWSAVRDSYPIAWDKAARGEGNSQLFQKVALLQLQEYILRTLRFATQFTKESPLKSTEELYATVQTALRQIPEDFFLTEWKKKGLDTNKGRQYFLEQLEEIAQAEGKYMRNFGLFKE